MFAQPQKKVEKKTSYRKIEPKGGFLMAREYTYKKRNEAEIIEIKREGKTAQEIAERCRLKGGKQVKDLNILI